MRQYHIALDETDAGKYCILPGDPGRCEKIAQYLENPYFVASNREYTTWTGSLDGERVLVTSTGMLRAPQAWYGGQNIFFAS